VIVGADNRPYNGKINPDGTYSVTGIPVGQAKIAVLSPNPDPKVPEPKEIGGKKKPLGPEGTPQNDPKKKDDKVKWFEIPDRYGDADKSGLTFTIQEGANTYPITLK
jgi:hypothetical protein